MNHSFSFFFLLFFLDDRYLIPQLVKSRLHRTLSSLSFILDFKQFWRYSKLQWKQKNYNIKMSLINIFKPRLMKISKFFITLIAFLLIFILYTKDFCQFSTMLSISFTLTWRLIDILSKELTYDYLCMELKVLHRIAILN